MGLVIDRGPSDLGVGMRSGGTPSGTVLCRPTGRDLCRPPPQLEAFPDPGSRCIRDLDGRELFTGTHLYVLDPDAGHDRTRPCRLLSACPHFIVRSLEQIRSPDVEKSSCHCLPSSDQWFSANGPSDLAKRKTSYLDPASIAEYFSWASPGNRPHLEDHADATQEPRYGSAEKFHLSAAKRRPQHTLAPTI